MKKTPYILLLSCIMLYSLCSCMVKAEYQEPEGQPVTIVVESGDTRATDPGGGIDSQIDKIRVLGYKSSDYTLAFNVTVADDGTSDWYNGKINGTIRILTGTYHFVFIANEDSDAALASALQDNDRINTWPKLRSLSISESAFSPLKSIPMVTAFEKVKVVGDQSLQDDQGQEMTDNGVWKVDMERLGVRVDLELEMSSGFANGAVLSFENVPDKVYLFPQDNSGATGTRTITAYPISQPNSDGVKLSWSRIILPESWFTPVDQESRAVQVCLTSGGLTKKARLGINPDPDTGTDYTMPRNYYFSIVGTVDEVNQLNCSAQVLPWDEALVELAAGNPIYFLDVDEVWKYGGTNLVVTTSYPGLWTAEISTSADEVTTTTGYIPKWWLGYHWTSPLQGSPRILEFSVNPNGANLGTPVFVHIKAGRLYVVARITQPDSAT